MDLYAVKLDRTWTCPQCGMRTDFMTKGGCGRHATVVVEKPESAPRNGGLWEPVPLARAPEFGLVNMVDLHNLDAYFRSVRLESEAHARAQTETP
jgi:hypothetical protein